MTRRRLALVIVVLGLLAAPAAEAAPQIQQLKTEAQIGPPLSDFGIDNVTRTGFHGDENHLYYWGANRTVDYRVLVRWNRGRLPRHLIESGQGVAGCRASLVTGILNDETVVRTPVPPPDSATGISAVSVTVRLRPGLKPNWKHLLSMRLEFVVPACDTHAVNNEERVRLALESPADFEVRIGGIKMRGVRRARAHKLTKVSFDVRLRNKKDTIALPSVNVSVALWRESGPRRDSPGDGPHDCVESRDLVFRNVEPDQLYSQRVEFDGTLDSDYHLIVAHVHPDNRYTESEEELADNRVVTRVFPLVQFRHRIELGNLGVMPEPWGPICAD
jgi:hypothetical protein